MKKETTKAIPIKKSDRPEPITKDSSRKQTPAATKTDSGGAKSEPEQFGEKENPKVDPSSQALNNSGSGVNDGSKSFNADE